MDVTDADSVAKMVQQVHQLFSRIDALVNTVGSFRAGQGFEREDLEDWDFLFRLNAKTALHTSRAVAPIMVAQGSGRIINIGAVSGLRGEANLSAYSASKSALMRLTESIARELAADGITANSVLPGVIDTPQDRSHQLDADRSGWVTPEQIAEVIRFLASPLASGVNQACTPVSGRGAF